MIRCSSFTSAFIFITLFQFLTPLTALAQPSVFEAEDWAVAFNQKTGNHKQAHEDFISLFIDKNRRNLDIDSGFTFQFLQQLLTKSDGLYFKARYNCAKAHILYLSSNLTNKDRYKNEVKALLEEAKELAYESEDEGLIAFVSEMYAEIIGQYGELGLSVMFSINAIQLYEKLNHPVSAFFYQFLSEMLYKIREYKDCVQYAKKAVATMKLDTIQYKKIQLVNTMNTVALGYHRLQRYDSAQFHYQEAYDFAIKHKDSLWAGIILGNVAQIFYLQQQYDTAYKMFMSDYVKSVKEQVYDNAANSLQWAAKTNLALGNKSLAMAQLKEAEAMLQKKPDGNYLRNIYATATQVYREMGMYDIAFNYNQLFAKLNDSLEKTINTSSVSISKARLNEEHSKYAIQSLSREKKSQIRTRNVIILAIVLISIIVLLVINRRRMHAKMLMEKITQEKALVEQEVQSARTLLNMFRGNIIEKTLLIDKLEVQIKSKENSEEKQQLIAELSQQTILTEDEWQKFKSMFEKVRPQFFQKLKELSPSITLAEQRMGALLQLQLTTKQMASMLGISVDSVHKTKQRLRQRLQLGPEIMLPSFFSEM